MVDKNALKARLKSDAKTLPLPVTTRTEEGLDGSQPDARLQNFLAAPGHAPLSTQQVLRLQRLTSNRSVSSLLGGLQSRRPRGLLQRAEDDANMLAQPQAGSAPLSLKDQYAFRYVYRNLSETEVKSITKTVLGEQLPQAIVLTQNDPNFPFNPTQAEANQVLTAYRSQVDLAPYNKSFTAYLAVWNDASISAVAARFTLINHLFDRLKDQFIPKVRSKYKRLDIEIDERMKKMGDKVGEIPDQPTRTRFANALKSLPGLKEIIKQIKDNDSVKKATPVIGKKEVTWQGGGQLVDSIVKRAAAADESAANDLPAELNTLKENIQKADNFYRALVEPDILAKIKRPTFVYHLVNAFDRLGASLDNTGKKSYTANQSGPEVHIGQGVFPHILIHEIGHYIEDNLPRDRWLDISLLLQSRHDEAGGGNLEAGQNPRLKGAYPASGDYTSSSYQTGTEISSMTLERLAQSGEVDDMIEKDPQQVAIVIRALRPTAYAEHRDLRPFDELLP